jgi:cell division transport system permease protein
MKTNTLEISKTQLTGSYLSVTISITLVIFMLGLIGLLLINANRLSDYAKENIVVSIFINNDDNEMDIIRLQKELDATDFVIETIFISKTEAAKMLKAELGEDFETYLGYNPLPSSIDVKLASSYANMDSIAKFENELKKNALVQEVYYQKSLVNLVNDNVRNISIVLFLFSILFFVISIALINNTIRLAFYSKRFIIHTMQLVGATHSFIKKPFILKSTFLGTLASLFAIFFMIVSIYFIQAAFEGIVVFTNKPLIFFSMLVIGVAISAVSTYYAVGRFLKMNANQLYY